MAWDELDQQAMERVLALAAQGYHAPPNPMVGALLVKDDVIVGQAYHKAAGEPHAEVLALEQAAESARGATLYINLEPCCHQGRTPPCAPRVVEAGVARVVVGMLDPDSRVSGGGVALLREAGLEVVAPPDPLVEQCLTLNRHFVHSVLKHRPFVTLKYAMTLDGRVATESGDSRWITGAQARQHVHQERAAHQAILVGSGTALRDDPRLNVRGVMGARQPVRIVADRRGRTPISANLFNAPGGPVWIAHGSAADSSWKDEMRAAGAEIFEAEELQALLDHLHQRGIRSLFVEGGPHLAGAFLDQGLVQRMLAYVAPVLVGAQAAPGPLAGRGVSLMKEAWRLKNCAWSSLGEDCLLEGELDCAWRSWNARC